jgi:hypothetical protein
MTHHDALVARLEADTQLSGTVFELGMVPTTSPPAFYVVVASSLGDWSQHRVTGLKTAVRSDHVLYAVGKTAAQARWVGGRIVAQLKDYRLTVSGRDVFPPHPWETRPLQIDKDGPITLPFVTIAFGIHSEPV